MTADTYGMVATIAYSMAAVFAVIAIVIFFTQHIRKVHDDLTGRTEQRAIADLRSGSVSRARFFVGGGADDDSSAAVVDANGRPRRRDGAQAGTSSSLKLRRFSKQDEVAQTAATGAAVSGGADVDAAESGTTLLGADGAATGGAPAADAGSESGTTLLGDAAATAPAASEASEAGTTLLGDTTATSSAGSGSSRNGSRDGRDPFSSDEAEAGTTLLGTTPDDSEAGTTLLGS